MPHDVQVQLDQSPPHPTVFLTKDELRYRYENATMLTHLVLERRRLQLLRSVLQCKRPIVSLRFLGGSGLPAGEARHFIQETETKALLRAIELKQLLIYKGQAGIDILKLIDPQHPQLVTDSLLLGIHRSKTFRKLSFLKSLDHIQFADWKRKKFTPNSPKPPERWFTDKKIRKKKQTSRRKLRAKEERVRERAQYALDKKLVVNLTDIEIPDYALAVLSYGDGYIPCPTFDALQFRLDGLNVANKVAWRALFTDRDSSSDLPSKLLKKSITPPCTTFRDIAIRAIKQQITEFADSLAPARAKTNMNMFEREGYQWLLDAVSTGTVAVTKADKGGAIIVTTPETIWDLCLAKLKDGTQFEELGTTDLSFIPAL